MTALATSMVEMLPHMPPWRDLYLVGGKWRVCETSPKFNWRVVEFLLGINLEPMNG